MSDFPQQEMRVNLGHRNQSWYQFNDEVVTHIGMLGAKVKPIDVIDITEEGVAMK